jgi:transposase
VTNRVNWTLARLADAIAAQEGVTISKSQLSKALRKKGAAQRTLCARKRDFRRPSISEFFNIG